MSKNYDTQFCNLHLKGLDTLREQLEYEHRRLDEARDAALKEAIEE